MDYEMKIETLIKADFFINPGHYGYHTNDDLLNIWLNVIKPTIKEIEYTKHIDELYIHQWIKVYRKNICDLIN